MSRDYAPSRGEIAWLEFTPQKGSEQSGHRPALVISPQEYNRKVGLALFCPITTQIKNYPYEVKISEHLKVEGVILCDQIKSLDWRSRKAKRICEVPDDILQEVIAKIKTLIE